ncbi:MAG: NYN domain-containing protein, partial [Tistlia sp.]|uniref:NYN domain-containing protein n=1 Tax=Tistlia sp. TaxID=3057121 RepID=UPI0034A40AEA
MSASDYLRAALFVDFDNVFSSLRERDAQAAESFSQYPLAWLSWFEAGRHALDEGETAAALPRRVLLRRCYLNPAAFWRQRAGFVQAGFQVVDCPSLTYGGKNSADIQMALDIVEALAHETRFDEFLLLSGDADFAPVLLRLRLHDRRTTILASEQVAPALRASADIVVPIAAFVGGALGLERSDALPPSEAELLGFLRETVVRAPRPLLLSQLGGQALRKFGESLREQHWLGAGSLSRLIEAKLAPAVSVLDRYVFAPERHDPPTRPATATGAASEGARRGDAGRGDAGRGDAGRGD